MSVEAPGVGGPGGGEPTLAPDPVIDRLLASHRVVVIAGAGGVGKTTTAAALALLAAARGRRVACLTIDPARRLAEALGFKEMSSEEQIVAPERFEQAGISASGTLVAMMLDTKGTFDRLISKHSRSVERARRLLDNKLYKHLSTSLAGTREYMAMEKLVELRESGRFDLVVLDTPPTTNALDFLDAPDRLIEAIDSAAVRWLAQAFGSTGKLTLTLLARSAAFVLRSLGRITGRGFLEDLAEFLAEVNDLFGGFKERARRVEASLRSAEVTFLIVTSPAPMSINEALFFSGRLAQARMPRGAFVVNRMRVLPDGEELSVTESEVEAAIADHGLRLGPGASGRMIQACRDAARLAALDRAHLKVLEEHAAGAVPVIRVLEVAGEVRDLRELWNISRALEGVAR